VSTVLIFLSRISSNGHQRFPPRRFHKDDHQWCSPGATWRLFMGNVRAELRAAGLLSSTAISHISTENLFRERRRICLREITFYDAFDTIPLVLVHEIVKGCDSYLANYKFVQPEKRNNNQGPLVYFVPQSNWLTGRQGHHHFSP